jgi:uncharacterized protein YciW
MKAQLFAAYISQFQATHAGKHAPPLAEPSMAQNLAASFGAVDAHARKTPSTPIELEQRVKEHLGDLAFEEPSVA